MFEQLTKAPTKNSSNIMPTPLETRFVKHLKTVRQQIVTTILVAGTVVGTLALLLSLFTSTENGWQVQQWGFVAVLVVWGIVTLAGQFIPYHVQAAVIVCATFSAGAFNILGWGLIGSGGVWMLITVLLATGFGGMRWGIIAYLAIALLYITMNLLVHFGLIAFNVDYSVYALSLSGWLSRSLFIIGVCAVVMAIVSRVVNLFATYIQQDLHVAQELSERTAALTSEIERRQEAEDALAQVVEHLKDLDRLKDNFIDSVSHELRTPIANLQLYHQLLAMRPEKREEYLETLTAETERLNHIVEQMLYASSAGDDLPATTMVENDLFGMATVALNAYTSMLTDRDITLDIAISDTRRTILAAPEHVDRLLANLVDNAVKYTPEGGIIRLTADTTRNAGTKMAGLHLSNTVHGFVPHENANIFERFVRGKTALEMGVAGAGLGLPIAAEITKKYGGSLDMHYQPDNMPDTSDTVTGTITFTLWLPESGQLRPPAHILHRTPIAPSA